MPEVFPDPQGTNHVPLNDAAPASVTDAPAEAETEVSDETNAEPETTARQRILGGLMAVFALLVPLVLVFFMFRTHAVSETRVFTEPKGLVTTVAFSPDGDLLAGAGADGNIYLWNRQSGILVGTFKGHTRPVHSIQFSADGSQILAGDMLTARIWDIASGKEIFRADTPTNFVLNATFSPDGKYFTTTSKADPYIRLWSTDKKAPARFVAQTLGLSAAPLGFSPLSTATSFYPGQTGPNNAVRIFMGHEAPVQSVVFFADGKRILSAGGKTVRLWDVATGNLVDTFEISQFGVTCIALAPDEKTFAVASGDQSIHLWNMAKKKEIYRFKGHQSPVVCVDFSPDGRYLVSSSLGTMSAKNDPNEVIPVEVRPIRIWDIATKQESFYLAHEDERVWSVKFSPDSRQLLSGGASGKVRLWNMP